jgi:hypothetical protein
VAQSKQATVYIRIVNKRLKPGNPLISVAYETLGNSFTAVAYCVVAKGQKCCSDIFKFVLFLLQACNVFNVFSGLLSQ